MPRLNFESIARAAEGAADLARRETLPRFRSVSVEIKADGSPVTEADRAAERAIRKHLRQADNLATRRSDFFKKVVADLFKVGKKLYERGNSERALKTLAPLLPIAEGSERAVMLVHVQQHHRKRNTRE